MSCDVQWDLQRSLLRMRHLADIGPGSLSFDRLRAQLEAQHPLACRILSPGPFAHFVVIVGCAQTTDGQRWVTVADPSPTTGDAITLLYDDLATNYHPNGRWDKTYLTK